jgi:hypothetical protein
MFWLGGHGAPAGQTGRQKAGTNPAFPLSHILNGDKQELKIL